MFDFELARADFGPVRFGIEAAQMGTEVAGAETSISQDGVGFFFDAQV